MSELMRFNLERGGVILVEVDEDEPGIVRASRVDDVIKSSASSFGAAIGAVRDAAAEALHRFTEMSSRPTEIELEFGVRLNVQAGAVIAKTAVDGHLKVKLVWRAEDSAQT
ncbi:hypothetical protein HCN51_05730 [Nonomuraea sp. FMUSA5-5]|uniref:Trypsin-co-occurring domain-containing protein n=1 Tax=Nonomuraea composti TaxID=2720023 RepID=A0ABX1ATJ4_9ACTN|nr:CU044_2847 family protein [Nonomuraea sp. FMUSA5-5]NJP88960.1 hypothetical protein [Nonomuraea sp. FMUSA5-5]